MRGRKPVSRAAACLVALVAVSATALPAEGGTITINVPVKLSKLANELKQFRVECVLLHNHQPFSWGNVQEDASVTRNITANGFDDKVPVPVTYSDVAASQITGYHCELFFYDPTPGGFWLQPTPQGTGKPIQQVLPGFSFKVEGTLP